MNGSLTALFGAWLMMAVAEPLAIGAPAHAQDSGPPIHLAQLSAERTFDIAAQSLTTALTLFGQQSGLQVTVHGTLPRNMSAPAVRGTMTSAEALTRLLAGSGLTYVVTDETTVAIERPGQQNDDGAMVLGPIAIEGQAESAYGPVEGYRASRSATATRTDTPILETPASIQIVPEQVIADQASLRLRDVYHNVSGVEPSFTGFNVATTEVPIIRGFRDDRIFRNGFRLQLTAPTDLANIERVEVLKGPASTLFGLGEPGGILNLVTKRPVNDTFAFLEQEVGSYNLYRTTVDANAPLTRDNLLFGRLNAAYTSDDTFRDHDGMERAFIAPTLTWQPTDATSVTIDFSYSYEDYAFDHGLAFSADGEPVADVSTFLGEPDFRSEREEFFVGYSFVHDFNDRLTFRNTFLFQDTENRVNAFRHFGSTNPDNTVTRFFERFTQGGDTIATVSDLGYKFETGSTRHHVLAGVDARWADTFQGDGGFSSPGFEIDIVNPQYGQFNESALTFEALYDFESELNAVGIYLQNQITTANDRLHLLMGGRYDYVDQSVESSTFEAEQTDRAFTFRGGALYELTEWLSPYVTVAQSFNPTSPFTTSVDGLEPEEGVSYEAGLKLSFFDGRLISTLAGYQITKDNVPVTDPNNPNFSINGGELRSRGFEVDIAGGLMPGWQVIANYAYTDTEVIESDSLPEGSRFRNVPPHSASLWSRYDFQPDSGLEGFGFGAGVRGVSDRLGDDAGTFELDGFVVVDAALWYRDTFTVHGYQMPVRAQLNVQNLLDEKYYESSVSTSNVYPGAPRTVIGTLSIEF